jgi:hypothetical protein
MPSEALTTPALLSQRERRENDPSRNLCFPSLPPGESLMPLGPSLTLFSEQRGQGSEGFGGHTVARASREEKEDQ